MNHQQNHLIAKVKAVNETNRICNEIAEKIDVISHSLLGKKLITQKEELSASSLKFLLDFANSFERSGIDSSHLLFSGRGGYRFSITVKVKIGYYYESRGRVEETAIYQERTFGLFRLQNGIATEVFKAAEALPTDWTTEKVEKKQQEIQSLENQLVTLKTEMIDFKP